MNEIDLSIDSSTYSKMSDTIPGGGSVRVELITIYLHGHRGNSPLAEYIIGGGKATIPIYVSPAYHSHSSTSIIIGLN